MMHKLRTIVAASLILSALLVFAWIGYAKWTGIPIEETCMGFRRDWRIYNSPAWVAPLMIEAAVLVLFCLRSPIGEQKVRFLIGGFSAFALLFSLVLPMLIEQVYGAKFFAFDVAVWWYACFSNIAYGLVGSSTSAA